MPTETFPKNKSEAFLIADFEETAQRMSVNHAMAALMFNVEFSEGFLKDILLNIVGLLNSWKIEVSLLKMPIFCCQ